MLDIQLIRDNPELIKKACLDKQLDPKIVDEVLTTDQNRRQKQQQVDELRQQANKQAELIKISVAGGQKPTPEQLETGKNLKLKLKALEPELTKIEEEYKKLMFYIT